MTEALFELRRARYGWVFLRPLVWGKMAARVSADEVVVKLGALGGAEIPIRLVDRIATMNWPWWGGIGVRLGKGLVAFVPGAGECSVLELSEPVKVRAPLRWRTQKVVIAVADVEAFNAAVAASRRVIDSARAPDPPEDQSIG